MLIGDVNHEKIADIEMLEKCCRKNLVLVVVIVVFKWNFDH